LNYLIYNLKCKIMNVCESVFILAWRDISIATKLKADDISKLLGKVTPEEYQLLATWKIYIQSIFPDPLYSKYDPVELKGLLELKTGHPFPIPISFLGKKDAKQRILAYYLMKNFTVVYPDKIWTEEQLKLLDPNIEGIYVCNCSAGCGKTTVANERAYRLREQGVMLMSYTNEAINENYTRLFEYPGTRGVLGKKDYQKRLNVTTADSLAAAIIGSIGKDNHDESVRAAIDQLQSDPTCCSKFRIPGLGPLYSHIIVDECQDIDDLRGELIIAFYRTLRSKSLCLFGDPKQRIRQGSGNWYTNLWTNSYIFPPLPNRNIEPKIEKVGFTYSHRFQNPKMIELVNSISIRRPHIHHELIPHPNVKIIESTIPIEYIGLYDGYEDSQLEMIANYIKNILHGEYKISYNQIAVVGPSLSKDNKTSTIAQKIHTVFKHVDIPCYTRSEGNFKPNGVLFSTIHSVKGKEFDFVFIYGISNYPESFHMIPYEEAESLIFVLHSRARNRIIYLCSNNNFIIPRGIDSKYIASLNNSNNLKPNEDKEPETFNFKVSEVSRDFGLQKFLSTNNYYVTSTTEPSLKTSLFPPPSGLDSRFWSIMCHMGIQMVLIDSHLPSVLSYIKGSFTGISRKEYESMKRKGLINNGRNVTNGELIVCINGINTPRPEEIEELKIIVKLKPSELSWKQRIILTQIYDYIIGDTMQSRYDIKIEGNILVNDLYKKMAKELVERFGTPSQVEVYVKDCRLIGCVDAIIGKYCLEFKTVSREISNNDLLQCWIYKILHNTVENAIVINLQNGSVVSLNSPQHILRWKYILEAYTQIRIHTELVQYRLTKSVQKGNKITKFPLNTFTVDTEFAGYGSIFDLACINLNDPFHSLVQTISVQPEHLSFAMSWSSLKEELFTSSPKLNEVQELFYKLQRVNVSSPVNLNYYISPVDVSWCDYNKTNLGTKARQVAFNYGCYVGQSSVPPKLTDLYTAACKPLEFSPHLKIHTALGDSLILYELLTLGIL